jgi:hypothetical protein
MGAVQRYEIADLGVSGNRWERAIAGRGTPVFFVSVASKWFSKGFRWAVSLLFATLAERSISVAVKGLRRARKELGGMGRS